MPARRSDAGPEPRMRRRFAMILRWVPLGLLAAVLWRERPWAALTKGKEITPLSLASVLQPYGMRPRTIWIGDEQGKGYYKEELWPLFRRYVPASEIDELLEDSKREEAKRKESQGAAEPGPEPPRPGDA